MVLTGRLVVLQLLGIVPAIIWPRPVTVVAWFCAVLALGLLDFALATAPIRLQIGREPLTSTRIGGSATSVLRVRNSARTVLVGEIRDSWVPSAGANPNLHRIRLRAGDGARVTTPLTPTRRGELAAGSVTVRSWGPLRLAGRQLVLPSEDALRVLPEFRSRRHLPSRFARLREMDGRAAVQVRGEGTEFDSLREYVIGDDVRSIDWRATARRSEVVVRTWRPERDRRVLIVVDAGRTSAMRVDEGTRLDAGIEAALLLTALATHAGDRVDVVAFDRELVAAIPAANAENALAVVADGLAGIEPSLVETDWQAVANWIEQNQRRQSLVVLITGLEPSAIEAGLMPVIGHLTKHHKVILGSARTATVDAFADDSAAIAAEYGRRAHGAEASADAYELAARVRAELDRDAVARELARQSVSVIDVPGVDLAPKVSDRYIELKAIGQL